MRKICIQLSLTYDLTNNFPNSNITQTWVTFQFIKTSKDVISLNIRIAMTKVKLLRTFNHVISSYCVCKQCYKLEPLIWLNLFQKEKRNTNHVHISRIEDPLNKVIIVLSCYTLCITIKLWSPPHKTEMVQKFKKTSVALLAWTVKKGRFHSI